MITDNPKKNSFFRLLKYATPYKFRLIVGIIAGFLVGGSMFGSFMLIPQLMTGVESVNRKTEQDQAKGETKQISKEEQKELDDSHFKTASADIKKLEFYAKKFGIPAEVTEDSLVITSPFKITIPAIDKTGKMSWQFFSIYVMIFILGWSLKNLATYINKYCTRWVGTKVVADLRNQVFEKLMDQSLKFYGKIDVGQLISRCTNDTAAVETAVANTIADATRCPIEILACIIAIIYASMQNHNYALPLILFIGLPACILPLVILGRKIKKIYKKAFAKIAEVVSRMHEVFTGIRIVKAYHTEKYETEIFKSVNRKYFRTVIKALKAELLMDPTMEAVAVAATLIFLVYSYSQNVTLTELAQLLIPSFMAYPAMKNMAKITAYLQKSMAAADRFFELLDTDTSIKEKANPVEIKEFKHEIRFTDVVFSYDNGKKILNGITLCIPKGHMVAVVGETGSGKTTIANLIARFYDVDSGSVSIDGTDVRDMKIASVRDMVGIVNQDAILFNNTIAENIAYGCSSATREQIIEAAKQANAHQFIVDGRHPEGYDTVAGEKGFKFSGGEKQRISIARAIVKNPPILILDEATSALDTVTENLVQEALNKVMKNRTIFAIAHRLSTIKNANTIIVLDKGRIIESGSHDELIAMNGRYKKLYQTQFGGDSV